MGTLTPRYASIHEAWSHAWTPYCKLASAGRTVLAVYMAEMRALDASSGAVRWQWHAPQVIAEHVVLPDAVVAVAAQTIHWISMTTGALSATAPLPGTSAFGHVHPAVLGDRVFWTTPSLLWSASSSLDLTSQPLPAGMTVGAIAAAPGLLVVSHHRERYECVSAVTERGEVLWEFGGSFDEGKSPNVLDVFANVVAVRQGEDVVGLALTTGVELWRIDGVGTSVFAKAGPDRLVRVTRPRARAVTTVLTLDVERGTEVDTRQYRLLHSDKKLAPGDTTALVDDGIVWLHTRDGYLVGIGPDLELSGDTLAAGGELVAGHGWLAMNAESGIVAMRYER